MGDLGSIPELGRSPGEGDLFWPREVHGLYRPWGHKESDTTERISLSLAMQKTVSLNRFIFAFVAFALGVKTKNKSSPRTMSRST